MSDKKSSLGRGAASIFSGMPQPSEVETQPLKKDSLDYETQISIPDNQKVKEDLQISKDQKTKDQKTEAESQQAYAETQTLKGEEQNVVIQPSFVESQTMIDEIDDDETHKSAVEIQKIDGERLKSESQQTIIRDQIGEAETQSIDIMILEQAIEEATQYPKITIYSPMIASVMKYREITTPRFKLSPEAEVRLEKVLKRENPGLWKAIEEKISWSKRKNSQKMKAGAQQTTIRAQKMKDESQKIDEEVLEQAIKEGSQYPKISIYSPIIAALMRYKEITTPRFKLSPEAEIRLRKVLKNEDPELWKAIEEKIQWKKRAR